MHMFLDVCNFQQNSKGINNLRGWKSLTLEIFLLRENARFNNSHKDFKWENDKGQDPWPSPLTEVNSSVQLGGGGNLFSLKKFSCRSPGTDHKTHWLFRVEHKLKKPGANFSSHVEYCVFENGSECSSFASWWNSWALSVIQCTGAFPLRAASCREWNDSDLTAHVLPFFLLSQRAGHIRPLSGPPRPPRRAWVHLISGEQCVHVKALI